MSSRRMGRRHRKPSSVVIDNMDCDNDSLLIDIDFGWQGYFDFNHNADNGKGKISLKKPEEKKNVVLDTPAGKFAPGNKVVAGKHLDKPAAKPDDKPPEKLGDKIGEKDSKPETEKDIFQYVIEGDMTEVVRYVKTNPDRLNVANPEGYYLIHLAILNLQEAIFQEFLKSKVDLSVVDPEGKSVLHQAVQVESSEMVSLLLSNGVPAQATDNTGAMPIHIAAEVGSLKIMTILLPTYSNLNVKGEGGQTPLHVAASHNQENIIRLLVQNGASPLTKDDHGTYPIHCAAKNAANNAIEALVEAASNIGIDKQQIMSLQDREKNMPIHCAVISGNIQTVKVCLKCGAFVNSQQADGSTSLHLAAAQGLVDMARAMHEVQKELFYKSVNRLDLLKRTPLHWSTIFNHTEMIEYLLDKGSRINSIDVDSNTPLLIAASKGRIETMKILIDAGAEPHVRDKVRRNFLHLLVLAMETAPDLMELLKGIKNAQKLIKTRDIYGFTALHYATKCGHLGMFTDLLKMGSPLSLKSNKKQTILHLAAQFGRYKTCTIVLSKSHGITLQNEPDEFGMTPLHLAATCGQLRVVSLLLDKGVSVSKDNKNNTPLHLAANFGRVDCMKSLLDAHRNLLNMTNADGNTALHLAAASGFTEAVVLLLTEGATFVRNNSNFCFYDEVIAHRHQEVALAIIQHQRWKEVFLYMSPIYGTFMIGLIRSLPDICLLVLDRCVSPSEDDPNCEEYYIEYNFTYLNLPENFPMFAEFNKLHYVPLLPLDEMVKNNRVELLSHPLCINFLKMKWNKYGVHLNFIEMSLYFIYLATLTIFILRHDPFEHDDEASQYIGGIKAKYPPKIFLFQMNSIDYLCVWYVIVYSFANLIKMILMLILVQLEYFSFNLLLDSGVHVSALIFALPFMETNSTHLQWQAAAVCIFLSWFNCLVNLQRFDLFGIYVVMFMEILKTLFQVVMIFSVLNVAFGLAFYVLLIHEKNNSRSAPWISIYHTFLMLMEIDFLNSFNEPLHDDSSVTLHFPVVTFILLMVFLLFMPILLINLLIGLAVGDIEAVLRGARLKRLATQVSFHSGAESKLPFLRSMTDEKLLLYPNKYTSAIAVAYNKMVGMGEVFVRDAIPEDSVITRAIVKTNTKLGEIDAKLDKNIALMNKIMKRLHMNVEEELWDEGGVFIPGIGEIEEMKTKKASKETKSK